MKDPAFLFYSDNFLSGTMFFNDEQTGKYIRLLCAQHQTGHLEEKHMIFICKGYDEDIFKKFIKDESGKYFNERLESEIIKRRNYSESRSNNKKGKTKQINNTKIISKSYDNHMGNGNGIGNINIDFNSFWDLYDKKVGAKNKCEKKWNKLKFEVQKNIIDILPNWKSQFTDKQFQPFPETFLNQERWNDEITKKTETNGKTISDIEREKMVSRIKVFTSPDN
jgi:hypothetical protein